MSCKNRTLLAALVTYISMSCGCSSSMHTSDASIEYIPNGSFEFNGEPSYRYWRMTYPAFVGFSAEAPENGGSWSLAVSSGRVFIPIVGAKNGETYRLTALVKRVEHGSPGISLGIGPTFPPKSSGGGMSTNSPNWTWLKTQATVKLEPGDTLWAILSSSASEFGIGLFDRVSLERIESSTKDSAISTSFYRGHHSYGNGWTEPAPEIGWDSLYARIVYPRLPLMVGFEAIVWTRILIDYDGNVDTIDTHVALAPSVQNVPSESFVEAVKTAFRSTKWRMRGHSSGWYSIPVYFFTNNSWPYHRIFIEEEMPVVKTHSIE